MRAALAAVLLAAAGVRADQVLPGNTYIPNGATALRALRETNPARHLSLARRRVVDDAACAPPSAPKRTPRARGLLSRSHAASCCALVARG